MKFCSRILLILTVLTFMVSCQDSIPETIEEDQVGQLNANTNLSNLIGRVALNDGSKDNIIDRANNITIVLPITVTVNGIEINVTTANDYQLVENAIEAFSDDDDIVNIAFPIDIIFSNYTRVTVSNQDEFSNYVSQSTGENEADEDIECIDFMFPITLEALEVNGAIPITLEITNNAQLFELIDDLDDYASVNFNFPITLITFDGIEIVVNDLDSLEETIENNIDACDEDDDFDFNDDDEDVLIDFLTNGNWIIDEYATDEDDFTEDYNGYIFTFDSTSSVNGNNGVAPITGSWTIDNSDPNNLLVVLDFGAISPFDVLNENWNITEYEADRLALEFGSEITGDLKILVFEKL